MNDAEYIAAIAEFYKDGPGPEFRAHYERLTHISAAIAAAPSQPRDDAWAEWCALRSNQPAAQALDRVRIFWQQHTQADALSMSMDELHADVERVIRAAPGHTRPAPAMTGHASTATAARA